MVLEVESTIAHQHQSENWRLKKSREFLKELDHEAFNSRELGDNSKLQEMLKNNDTLKPVEKQVFQIILGIPQTKTPDGIEEKVTPQLVSNLFRLQAVKLYPELRNTPEGILEWNVSATLRNLETYYEAEGKQTPEIWERLNTLAYGGAPKIEIRE